jgi:hypothetical protein
MAGASEREAYAEALRRSADLIAAGATEEALEHEGDSLAGTSPKTIGSLWVCPRWIVMQST